MVVVRGVTVLGWRCGVGCDGDGVGVGWLRMVVWGFGV